MIYISIGSNIGNRLSHLQRATELLKKRYLKDLKSSIILETKAILPNVLHLIGTSHFST